MDIALFLLILQNSGPYASMYKTPITHGVEISVSGHIPTSNIRPSCSSKTTSSGLTPKDEFPSLQYCHSSKYIV